MDFRRVFESLPGLYLVVRPDPSLTIEAASDAYLATAGRERASLVGRALLEAFPDNPGVPEIGSAARLEASLRKVVATRQADSLPVHRYDVREAPGDGAFVERWWRATNVPVLGEDGAVALVVHRVEEVTELVVSRSRQALNVKATEILEAITEGFFTLDRDWRFTYLNGEALRLLGRPRDALLGRALWEAFPEIVGTAFEEPLGRSMRAAEATSFTGHWPSDGRWFDVTATPATEGITVYLRDVTAQHEAEAERARLVDAAARQQRLYEAALSNTPDLVYIFDLDHKFVYANAALLKMWGLPLEEALKRDWQGLGYELWHSQMHDREIDEVIATKRHVRGEVPFNGTEGRRVYDYIFAPVLGPDGEVVAVAGTTRDVTERKQAEQAIREQADRLLAADRAKDEFLATLSHELRNPLAPLRASVAMLREIGTPDPRKQRIHETMDRQVAHLVRLVDDLLEMGRLSRGTFSLRREPVDLAAVVRAALETSAPLVEAAHHRMTVSLPSESVPLDADPVRLAQVLANLLNNAAKYTSPGGHVRVEARRDGDFAEVRVSDDGPGIDARTLPRVFEMFTRGEDESARNQGGLGIGLWLARRLAELHGGTLVAESEGAGRGSAFVLRVPVATTAAEAPAAAPPTSARAKGRRVLVVDDNVDAAEMLGMFLEQVGAEVHLAHDGPEALAAYEAHDPELVLLDIGLPGMDGYEVARTVRSRWPERRTLLVALTGWGQEEDRRAAREAGFDEHLVKPAEMDRVRALLASLDTGRASAQPSRERSST